MNGIVNLNRARKRKARNAKEVKAAENRIKFGMTKVQRKEQEYARLKAERLVEGHRRETSNADDRGQRAGSPVSEET